MDMRFEEGELDEEEFDEDVLSGAAIVLDAEAIGIVRLAGLSFSGLYHVGRLDPRKRGARSLEGPCLSVSLCPEAWREIARLGRDPVWELTREGNRFLDAHALRPTQRRAVERWGCEQDWVRRQAVYCLHEYDSEQEEWRHSLWSSREKAHAELEGCVDETCDMRPYIRKVNAVVATTRMDDFVGSGVCPMQAPDMLLLAVATHCGWDGVYFDDILDAAALSAPRGALLPTQQAHWQVRKL